MMELTEAGRSHKKTLTRADINALPLYYYEGPVVFVNTVKTEEEALNSLKNSSVVGFDTETRPSFKKGVSYNPSLVQVATKKEVFVFQIGAYGFTDALALFLENKNILKAGVAIGEDINSLNGLKTFKGQGLVDLGDVARKNNINQHGLRGLAALFLGVRISKSAQCSNWGKSRLTEKQVKYAATDAWVSLAVYIKMKKRKLLS